eukprot:1144094-Rhodomonas_salina.2
MRFLVLKCAFSYLISKHGTYLRPRCPKLAFAQLNLQLSLFRLRKARGEPLLGGTGSLNLRWAAVTSSRSLLCTCTHHTLSQHRTPHSKRIGQQHHTIGQYRTSHSRPVGRALHCKLKYEKPHAWYKLH